MCGILAVIGKNVVASKYHESMNRLNNRGPEGTKYKTVEDRAFLGFTRLAINGLTNEGMQPMEHKGCYWIANGEIYNWRALNSENSLNCQTGSDCEVIGTLYTKIYVDRLTQEIGGLFRSLDGVFATAIVDTVRNVLIVARDPYGVRPLYTGFSEDTVMFGSEMKSLDSLCHYVQPFLPGTVSVYDLNTGDMIYTEAYHTISTIPIPIFNNVELAAASVRTALVAAVKKRMMMERPVAVLLSGGLDSSLVASLVAKELRDAGKPPLKTFSIGMAGSSDLRYAKMVADWIGSDHREVLVTPKEMFEAISPVIFHIESYDTTTVRASVGNWLVSKAVKEYSDCKVVFNGDGSDEIWGSYLYFYAAPSPKDYEDEVLRLLQEIHTFDVLRSDRSISSNGLEPRTPFLDKAFVQTVLSIPLNYRMPFLKGNCEKWLLRKAFDNGETLPPEVLWRRKEAFSDGVSGTEKSWFQNIQEMVVDRVPADWSEIAVKKYPVNTPTTAEMFYYRSCFEGFFAGNHSLVTVPHFWMPKWLNATDPSARTLNIYHEVKEDNTESE
jgi:asparagine synthase (glutamine-hydrolysing)